MTFVKNHLGLILPLFAILFALEYLLVFDRTVRIYQERLTQQYAVIVVADKRVDPSRLRNASVLVGSVEPVDAREVLKKLRRRISPENLEKLQAILPRFYTIKLRDYPSRERLERFKKALLSVKGVKQVQIFEKVHDKLYAMLLFMKSNF
jgi:cell division transport system permease protein